MKRLQTISLLIVSVLLVLSACKPPPAHAQEVHSDLPRDLSPQVGDSDLSELADGNNDFAFGLYQHFSAGDTNLFYSPYSISIALAMTYSGARGQTAGQMADALHFTLSSDRLHAAFNKLALELDRRSKSDDIEPGQAFQLSVANSLWGQSGFHFEQPFLDVLARNYAAGMRLVDFRKDDETARREINDWVSQSTNQKIKEIIPEGVLNALTRLVLANAVYFKAAWQTPFTEGDTQPGSFRLLDGNRVDVPMMREQALLNSAQGDGYQAVELPYVGWQLSMLILVPDEGRFGEMEAGLDAGFLDATVATLEWGKVNLILPKFKFEWSAELADGLKVLGMGDAFDPSSADFSGMDGARDLFIGNVVHKAFIAVDETGTEATAVTAVLMPASAIPEGVVDIKIDRPFLFVIRDNPTGTILFLGRVMNPSI